MGKGSKGHTSLAVRMLAFRKSQASKAGKVPGFPSCVGSNSFEGECPESLDGIKSADELKCCLVCPQGGPRVREWFEKPHPRRSSGLKEEGKEKNTPPVEPQSAMEKASREFF